MSVITLNNIDPALFELMKNNFLQGMPKEKDAGILATLAIATERDTLRVLFKDVEAAKAEWDDFQQRDRGHAKVWQDGQIIIIQFNNTLTEDGITEIGGDVMVELIASTGVTVHGFERLSPWELRRKAMGLTA